MVRGCCTTSTRSSRALVISSALILLLFFASYAATKGTNTNAPRPGLTAQYWPNTVLGNATAAQRVDELINFFWDSTTLPSGLSSEYFSTRWTGRVKPPVSGDYLFTISCDTTSGTILWVDGHLLVDTWTSVGSPRMRPAIVNITLDSSVAYEIELVYFHTTGQGYISLLWQEINGLLAQQVVPAQAFVDTNISDAKKKFDDLNVKWARGWNTWKVNNMLSHLVLPHSFGFNVVWIQGTNVLPNSLVQCPGNSVMLAPGLHSPNGSYTEVSNVTWNNAAMRIRSGHAYNGDNQGNVDMVMEITVLNPVSGMNLAIQAQWFLGQEGLGDIQIYQDGNGTVLKAKNKGQGLSEITIYPTLQPVNVKGSTIIFSDAKVTLGISTGKRRSMGEIRAILALREMAERQRISTFGSWGETFEIMHTVISWNTVYDPRQKVFTTFSRRWAFGPDADYAIADWDCYFGSWMAALVDPELAILNVGAVTYTQTTMGFVPNYASGIVKSRDRSEPPVGGIASLGIYRALLSSYPDTEVKWVLQLLWNKLYQWNTWWWNRRLEAQALLVWGSDPNPPLDQNILYNDLQAARYESGLDNSPMYDAPFVAFNTDTHHMELWDVGLNGMFIADCESLETMAKILGSDFVDPSKVQTLRNRRQTITTNVQKYLWNDTIGVFVNRVPPTASNHALEFYPRLGPPLFYPMIGNAANATQAIIMVTQHLLNPEEFCVAQASCPYAMPSIARNDPAFKDNSYWRGRIWGPMNMLVYLGLRRYRSVDPSIQFAIKGLVQQANNLLLGQWRAERHVQENYNAITGEGCDVSSADPFYHWGALNGFIGLMEAGYIVGPN